MLNLTLRIETKIDPQGRGLKIENECLFKSLEQK